MNSVYCCYIWGDNVYSDILHTNTIMLEEASKDKLSVSAPSLHPFPHPSLLILVWWDYCSTCCFDSRRIIVDIACNYSYWSLSAPVLIFRIVLSVLLARSLTRSQRSHVTVVLIFLYLIASIFVGVSLLIIHKHVYLMEWGSQCFLPVLNCALTSFWLRLL